MPAAAQRQDHEVDLDEAGRIKLGDFGLAKEIGWTPSLPM